VALSGFVVAGAILCVMAPWAMAPLLIANAVLAIGYTAPPLKLCWRGLGEIDVALTHSFSAVVCGSLAQGQSITAGFPWLLGMPLFWAVLPAIILSGVPDFDADRASGKRSLAVGVGRRRAVLIAEIATALAAATAFTWLPTLGLLTAPAVAVVIVPYAILQIIRLERFRASGAPARRIDSLMVLSLSFILLFVAFPLPPADLTTPPRLRGPARLTGPRFARLPQFDRSGRSGSRSLPCGSHRPCS
jgi:1,4-dihydroxy-2-naphthoate octaprenyltransferase